MHDILRGAAIDGPDESRPWRMIFIGSTSVEAKGVRNTLREVNPDWLYNWQPDGLSAVAYMIDNGLADIALIDAKVGGMSAAEVVGWIRASPAPRYIPIVIYNAADEELPGLLNCRADAVVSDSGEGSRGLVKIADQMIRCVRLRKLPSADRLID